MSTIDCTHCQQANTPLTEAPFPGELGDSIHQSICANCWDKWLGQQTMIINENRLDLSNPESRSILKQHMRSFLFEGCTEKPAGYTPEE